MTASRRPLLLRLLGNAACLGALASAPLAAGADEHEDRSEARDPGEGAGDSLSEAASLPAKSLAPAPAKAATTQLYTPPTKPLQAATTQLDTPGATPAQEAAAGDAAPPSPVDSRTKLAAPEAELALVKTDLDNLTRRLSAANQLAGRLGLGPQTASAERSWKHALAFFGQQEWDSTIRELSNYLNQTQVPDIGNHLKAQYMLGRSYEEMGYKSKSLRAYCRYLATFLTAKEPDHSELLDVLRRMIPLASGDASRNKELRELLASITSLELPKDVQPVVLFYAAKAALSAGEPQIAESWLTQAKAAPNDPVLKAKALYMQALMALSRNDYEQAKEFFSEVIQADNEGSTRGLARLALARLAVHQKERTTALKYYDLIEEDSTAFREATFESIYVHLDLKQNGLARSKSLLYLARWPDGPDSLQLRMLLAYLDMRAGDLTAASESIKAADARLSEINGWLSRKLGNASTVSQTTLTDLMTLTGGQLPLSPSVKEATLLFARLAEAAKRLADIRGSIRNTLYTIGRARLEQLRPFWANRAEQLSTLGDDLLGAGHRLAAVETLLYQDRLSAVDKQRLAASTTRRLRLLTQGAASHRKLLDVGTFAGFAELTQAVAKLADKLRQNQAELVAARHLLAVQSEAKASPGDEHRGRLDELVNTGERLAESLAKALELLRRAQVEDVVRSNPRRSAMKFLVQYASSLHEESEILGKVRDQASETAAKLNAEDASKAWAEWEFLAQDLFKQMDGLGHDTRRELTTLLAELEGQERRYALLVEQVHTITGELEGRLGQSLSYIIEQYTHAINARFARSQKWQGDIHWLTFQSRLDDEKNLKNQTDLEQQILRDNLSDLQQGALWPWPK